MAFNRGSIFLRRAVGSASLLRRNRYSPTALAFPACSPSLSTPTDHIEGDCNKKTFSSDSASAYHLQGGPSHMRAAVFWEPNKPLTLEDFHIPRPKANEVLIKTKGTYLLVFGRPFSFLFFFHYLLSYMFLIESVIFFYQNFILKTGLYKCAKCIFIVFPNKQ